MLVLTPQALADLDDIFDYIAIDNLERAIGFTKKLGAQMERLAVNPGIGRRRDELVSGLRSFPYGNYVIFYQLIDHGIEVIRILHGARDIEWLFQDNPIEE